MSASPNVNPRPSIRKLPGSEPVKPSRLDKFGRDPESPVEKLRGLSDYDTGTGFSPFFRSPSTNSRNSASATRETSSGSSRTCLNAA